MCLCLCMSVRVRLWLSERRPEHPLKNEQTETGEDISRAKSGMWCARAGGGAEK